MKYKAIVTCETEIHGNYKQFAKNKIEFNISSNDTSVEIISQKPIKNEFGEKYEITDANLEQGRRFLTENKIELMLNSSDKSKIKSCLIVNCNLVTSYLRVVESRIKSLDFV